MAVTDGVVIAVIGVIILEGLWLVALTYLLWRRKKASGTAEAPPAEASKPV